MLRAWILLIFCAVKVHGFQMGKSSGWKQTWQAVFASVKAAKL